VLLQLISIASARKEKCGYCDNEGYASHDRKRLEVSRSALKFLDLRKVVLHAYDQVACDFTDILLPAQREKVMDHRWKLPDLYL